MVEGKNRSTKGFFRHPHVHHGMYRNTRVNAMKHFEMEKNIFTQTHNYKIAWLGFNKEVTAESGFFTT